MKSVFRTSAIVVCLLFLTGVQSAADDRKQNGAAEVSLAIRNVTVIDVAAGEAVADQTVLIADGKILAVGSNDATETPADAQVIDGTGKFAIPGLWDMHIHWYDPGSMRLFPINGVTGVRLMWGTPMHRAWRDSFSSGKQIGPRLYIGSVIIDGPEPIWQGSLVAADAEAARRVMEQVVKSQADFAKVYSLLPRDAYFTIAAECQEKKIPFAGHVPIMVSAAEAAEAGQQTMEHLYEILLACSSEEEELRQLIGECVESEDGKVRAFSRDAELRALVSRRTIESFDADKAGKLFELFRQHETWQCPTLTVLHNLTYGAENRLRENPELQYMPRSMLSFLAPPAKRFERTKEAQEVEEQRLQLNYKILGMMNEAGVPILTGTDCLNPFCLPGFSLHGELELMVNQAGMKPIDALRAATINPAKMMDTEDQMGSIAAGKVADVVLLNANPLENISNTRKIDAVVLNGKHLDRSELDELLAAMEQKPKEEADEFGDD